MPDLNNSYDDIDDGFGEHGYKLDIGWDPSYLKLPQYMIGDDVFTPNKRFCNLTSEAKRIATEDYGFTEESYNARYAPDIPRFSITHIKKVFREVYNMEVVDLTVGYKAGRYQRFREYALKYLDTQDYVRGKDGKVFRYYMHALGQYLVNHGDY